MCRVPGHVSVHGPRVRFAVARPMSVCIVSRLAGESPALASTPLALTVLSGCGACQRACMAPPLLGPTSCEDGVVWFGVTCGAHAAELARGHRWKMIERHGRSCLAPPLGPTSCEDGVVWFGRTAGQRRPLGRRFSNPTSNIRSRVGFEHFLPRGHSYRCFAAERPSYREPI